MAKKDIEIPFGAHDSELDGFEYTIQEGYKAEIKDGKVVVRKTESEDERIRKSLIGHLKECRNNTRSEVMLGEYAKWIAWLEKQGKQKPIISNDALREGIAHFGITQYQIDNWLKKYVDVEKQGEQKPDETEKGANGNEREIPNSAWSDGDIVAIDCAVDVLSKDLPSLAASIERLKSLRPQNTWKPREHYELEEFAKIVRCNLTGISKAVQELFEAKYLQLTGNKMYGGFKD